MLTIPGLCPELRTDGKSLVPHSGLCRIISLFLGSDLQKNLSPKIKLLPHIQRCKRFFFSLNQTQLNVRQR